MNVKSLMLLLALAGLGASCSDDETTGGGTSGIPGRSELQIVFSGSGESQSYDKPTKAIATAKENQIDDLQIYLFAAASEGGPYYYLETWQDGTAYDPEHPETTNFKKTEAGTGWKASLYPNELPGVPYIKLFCIANKNVPGVLASDGATVSKTTDEKFYQEDGGTEILATLTPVTTAEAGDGSYTVTPGTTETDFIAAFTKALGAAADGVISTPLLMTGQGKTKISGNVSVVNIDLTRVAARFDIDNTTSKSNLTIKSVTLAQGRKTAPLWTAPLTKVEKADLGTSPLIAQKYEAVDFEKLTGANQGITESSLYVYPTLATDESYLILEGTYKSPVNSSQVPVTYHVPIVRTPEGGDKGEYIAINANNRYCLRITDVTLSNVYGTFDVVDWTSAGGITIRPDNDAPVFDAALAFDAASANMPTDLNAANPDATTYDYEVTGNADGAGSFSLTMAATGTVRCEKETMSATKAGETEWLTITADKTEERDGVWYTTFKFEYTNSIGQQPVAVHFINETASYDPALWTTVNFYGPKAVPSFALVTNGNSKGNITALTDDDAKKPTATIYSVNGSYVTFDITSIEGVTADALTGYKAEKVATNGFVHTFKVSVDAEATAVGGNMVFKNAGDPTKTTTLTITKADPSLSIAKSTDANGASDYTAGSETPFVTTGTLQVDLDLLAAGSCNFKVNSPQGLTVASLDCPWLTITEVHPWADSDGNRYTEYQLKKKDSPANTSDFNLVFTSKLTEQGITAPGFKLTLNKAYSKPTITPNADPSTYVNSTFNDGIPSGYPYAVIADMYKVNNSTIYLQMACTENMTVASSDANVSVTKQGDTNYYKIEVTNAAAAANQVTITASNDNDATRKATVTLTLIDPAVKLENPAGGVAPTLSGTTVTLPSTYVQYSVSSFDIVAPKGSTITCATSAWFTCTAPAGGSATIDASKKQTITLMGGDQTSTDDVTITVHNSVTNADETITVTKAP
ncbi:hypothetical protein HMPREF1212_02558 [Parabacteroides sp. HGS0025]|uniref:hypothetical protein n=1 Tax=Parabacteroides sp. HGS0025 TaxID=1078087 RepID=UPI0006170AD3|nr:hypothetical protein [Parabacteroides sp. HGS0025]KKB51822.1 hypothetical protein HMPREF1212_02558 [Parabacteroides sp. HGS0025]